MLFLRARYFAARFTKARYMAGVADTTPVGSSSGSAACLGVSLFNVIGIGQAAGSASVAGIGIRLTELYTEITGDTSIYTEIVGESSIYTEITA